MVLFQILGILTVVISLAFGFLCLDYHRHRWPVRNYPPGPYGWPVLGSPVLFGPQVHIDFEELRKKYGDVFSIALGRLVVVVVSGQDAVWEALVTNMNATAGRGQHYVQTLYNPEFRGIVDGFYSENWRRQRHFTQTALRSLGFGMTSFEDNVMVEVDETLNRFKQNVGHPLNPLNVLSAATTSVTCTVAMGVRFNCDDEDFLRLSEISHNWLNTMYRSHALNAFPFIRPFSKRSRKDVNMAFEGLASFARDEIQKHEASFDIDNEPRDLIDCYLAAMRSKPELYTREDLTMILIDLFLGGNETAALLLTYGLLHMIRNPDIQEKVHQELIQVVGCTRLPMMEDKDSLPYTVAVLNEIMRHNSQTPLMSRAAMEDVVLGGYNISKGTTLMINAWSIHHDPKAWPNPDEFDPNRFLTTHNKNFIADSGCFLPFGAGRKVCLGKHLGKMELFLFFACMMHQFKFSVPPGCDKPSAAPTTRFLNYPPYYELMISPRFP